MLDAGIQPPTQMFSNLKQALIGEGKKDTVLILYKSRFTSDIQKGGPIWENQTAQYKKQQRK
jgi:hypothetical protein